MLGNKVILCNPLDVVNEKEDGANIIWTLGKPFAQKHHQRTKPCQKEGEKKNLKKNSQSIHKMKLVQINFIVFGDPYKTKPTTVYKGKSEKTRIEAVASQ